MTLENDPNIALDVARLRSSQGSLLNARGDFDPLLVGEASQTSTDIPLTESTSRERRVVANTLGVTKRFRTGLSIEPTVELLRTADDQPGAVNQGTVAFTLRQPLLRGRGRSVADAPELAAERQVAASTLDLRQTTSERVLTVVSQYWQTRAAALNLDVLRASETSARELLETTRRLIEADVTPAADLVQVEANLVSKETARIGGERQLFQARQALGREIGLESGRIASLPLPVDPFPVVSPGEVPGPADGPRYVAAALARRADLQAARERRNALEIELRAADNALLPQVDLVLQPSYSGLVSGTGAGSFFSPLARNVPGLGSFFALSLSWPTLNNRARGVRLQIEAARTQSSLLEDLIVRQIGADVPAALDAVERQAQQLERAAEAVRLFERAVVNEEKKLQAGTSTLIDVISQRDRLTAARQAQVSASLALALALAELRFETGTLIAGGADGADGDEGAGAIEERRLTTVPSPDGEGTP